jgi:hypothetical protein
MDLKIRINKKQRLAYIPKVLFDILGTDAIASPNRSAILLYSDKTSIDDAIRSLDIIKADLLHAKALEELCKTKVS